MAHCDNTACTSATVTTLDSAGFTGQYTSITIGADGFPVISYFNSNSFDLKVAHCDNTACTSATTSTVDSAGSVGRHTSITIGADGFPVISYFNSNSFDLKVAHCDNTACTSATTSTVDSAGRLGGLVTSVAIGADGLGLISYHDFDNGDLKVVHRATQLCVPHFQPL